MVSEAKLNWQDVAKNGLVFMERVDMKGAAEAAAFMACNQLLGGIQHGQLVVYTPEQIAEMKDGILAQERARIAAATDSIAAAAASDGGGV